MQVLTVIANPKANSTTHKLAQSFNNGLQAQGAAPVTVDLYAQGFDPVLTQDEIDGWYSGRLPPAVSNTQRLLAKCSGLALVFPVWWNAPPAILSGWLQRMLSEGFAFGVDAKGDPARLKLRVQLILTAGSAKTERDHIYTEPLLASLQYCGVQDVDILSEGGVHENLPAARRESLMQDAHTAGEAFARQLLARA